VAEGGGKQKKKKKKKTCKRVSNIHFPLYFSLFLCIVFISIKSHKFSSIFNVVNGIAKKDDQILKILGYLEFPFSSILLTFYFPP